MVRTFKLTVTTHKLLNFYKSYRWHNFKFIGQMTGNTSSCWSVKENKFVFDTMTCRFDWFSKSWIWFGSDGPASESNNSENKEISKISETRLV